MAKKVTCFERATDWILAQPAGTVLTPTETVHRMKDDGIPMNSGTTSRALSELVEQGIAVRVGPMGSVARRGAYKTLPHPVVPLQMKAPALPFDPTMQAAVLTDKERAIVNAIFKIQEGLDELQAALVPHFKKAVSA